MEFLAELEFQYARQEAEKQTYKGPPCGAFAWSTLSSLSTLEEPLSPAMLDFLFSGFEILVQVPDLSELLDGQLAPATNPQDTLFQISKPLKGSYRTGDHANVITAKELAI